MSIPWGVLYMLKKFQEHLAENRKADNTIKSYFLTVKGFILWHQGIYGQPPDQLTRQEVLNYVTYLRTVRGLTNRSVNTKLAALQALNEFLIETGCQTELVLSKRDYLRVQTAYANPSTISRDQVETFRQQILAGQGLRDYAIVTVLAYAGLRISEVLALRLGDVDLAAREITVQHGKGDKMRVVFIGDKVVNAIKEYLQRRPSTDSPYLFLSRKGGALSRGQVNRIFNLYSDTITPHTLRHFFCSNAIEAGYSINEVANQAGHSNIHTTLLYTNPTRERMKEKANLL